MRFALVPSLLAAIVLACSPALLATQWASAVLYVVAILAVIVGWYAVQAKAWWWAVVMLAVTVVWNPVVPFGFSGAPWLAAHWVAAIVFLAAGFTIRTRRSER